MLYMVIILCTSTYFQGWKLKPFIPIINYEQGWIKLNIECISRMMIWHKGVEKNGIFKSKKSQGVTIATQTILIKKWGYSDQNVLSLIRFHGVYGQISNFIWMCLK